MTRDEHLKRLRYIAKREAVIQRNVREIMDVRWESLKAALADRVPVRPMADALGITPQSLQLFIDRRERTQ